MSIRGYEPTEHRTVGWLELFFDLVFVACFVQLGDVLAKNPSPMGWLGFTALFVPIWWSWSTATFYANRFAVDDGLHRVLVLAQMLALGVMAYCLPSAWGVGWQGFALAYVAVRVLLVVQYARVYAALPEARPLVWIYGLGFSSAAVVWTAAAFAPDPWRYVLWIGGLVLDFAAPHNPRAMGLVSRWPLHLEHLGERFALLTILVLGETFLKLSGGEGYTVEHVVHAALAVGVLGGLWAAYFDRIPAAKPRQTMSSVFGWIYLHLPLSIGLIGTAVGLAKISHVAPMAMVKPLYGAVGPLASAIVWASLAGLEVATTGPADRGHRVQVRLGAAAALVVLAWVGGALPSVAVMGCWAAVGLAVALSDRG